MKSVHERGREREASREPGERKQICAMMVEIAEELQEEYLDIKSYFIAQYIMTFTALNGFVV